MAYCEPLAVLDSMAWHCLASCQVCGHMQEGDMRKSKSVAMVAAIATLLAIAPTTAAAASKSGTSPSFYTTGFGTPLPEDPEVTSELSREFRSEKPNAIEELEKYLAGPRPAKHITRAADLRNGTAVTAATATPNPVSVDECRAKLGSIDDLGARQEPKYWYKDRFNSCTGAAIKINKVDCRNGICASVGFIAYRLVIVGHGNREANSDDSRTMTFQWFTDQGRTFGDAPPEYDYIYNGLICNTYTNVECGFDRSYGMATVAELRNGWTSPVLTLTERNTSTSPDNKIYYDLRFTIKGGMGEIWSPKVQILRSDTATYANKGGFVFMDVESWFQYDFVADRVMYHQVKHVWDAQNRIESTKPGDKFTKVAGSRASGSKLTRLAPNVSPQNDNEFLKRYNRNNYIAVLTCKQYFHEDYATRHGARECDEYPYRSTFEGAAYTENDGGAGIWSYSARPIPQQDNSIGGGTLSAFYIRDHIVHGDTFWVDIVGQPDPNIPDLQYD